MTFSGAFRIDPAITSVRVHRNDTLSIRVIFGPDSAAEYFDTLVVTAVGPPGRVAIPLRGVMTPTTSVDGSNLGVPLGTGLGQNYPNPFNPETNFELRIADLEFVNLAVFDVLGREVASLVNEQKPPGIYAVRWNAWDKPSGVYFVVLSTEKQRLTRRIILAH
jgi:hypothetical protein